MSHLHRYLRFCCISFFTSETSSPNIDAISNIEDIDHIVELKIIIIQIIQEHNFISLRLKCHSSGFSTTLYYPVANMTMQIILSYK